MRFFKMENLGNDYIYTFSRNISKEKIIKMCDRNFGIGGDGVVIIYKKNGNYGIKIFNSDGSKADFCGNATLSIGYYLILRNLKRGKFSIITDSGERQLEEREENGERKVCLTIKNRKFFCSSQLLNCNYIVDKQLYFEVENNKIVLRGSAVDVGNLHFVVFGNFSQLSSGQMDILAQKIENCGYFPCGVNIEFVEVKGKNAYISVHERGSGWTCACGSGLVAVAFVMEKLFSSCGVYNGIFKGGNMEFLIENGEVTLFACPKLVFSGVYSGN